MKKDIEDRSDIEILVNSFYEKVKADSILAHLFDNVDWAHHLPRMYDFWSTIIFNTAVFKGNPVEKHLELNRKQKLEDAHFDQWIKLWKYTIEEKFYGANAMTAIDRAVSIKAIIQYKLKSTETNQNLSPSK